eukprot:TRINITY_DN8545_c0_g1_i3.p1 TRINITY_DN8545_c0_g1~~TRINITY_DN8545_c0_g1_i3.p1  ORF type:complete len:236 (+),score=30.51 TRINITY_DN8545_c0_g1_i3:161-868(+)
MVAVSDTPLSAKPETIATTLVPETATPLSAAPETVLAAPTPALETPAPTDTPAALSATPDEAPKEGTLEVTIYKADKLLAADSNGFSDPYVILKYEGQTAISTIKPKNLSPEWNESFSFRVIDPYNLDPAADVLIIEVFDKDLASSDDSLGMGVVSLGGLQSGKEKIVNVPLKGVPESLGSTIKIGLYATVDTPPDDSDEEEDDEGVVDGEDEVVAAFKAGDAIAAPVIPEGVSD